MPGDDNVARTIGNSDFDILVGRLIERTNHMSKQADKLAGDHEVFTEVVANINLTLTKMQAVLDGIVENRKTDREQITAFETRVRVCEGWKDDIKFIQDLRAGWTKVLVGSLIVGAIVVVAAAKFGSVTGFME